MSKPDPILVKAANIEFNRWADSLYRGLEAPFYFRDDAAFANPEIYEFLGAEDYGYVIRLPANEVQDNLHELVDIYYLKHFLFR